MKINVAKRNIKYSVSLNVSKTRIVYQALCYMFVVCVLLSGNVMMHYVEGLGFPSINMFKLGALVFASALILFFPKYQRKELIFLLVILLYLGFYAFATWGTAKGYIFKYVVPVICFIMLAVNQIKNRTYSYVLEAFINIMALIACFSLVMWVFTAVLPVLPSGRTVYYEWSNKILRSQSYGNLFFLNPVQSVSFFGKNVYRNTAIWTEAPGFSAMLCYALVISLLKNKKAYTVVFVLALISTISGKAFVILIEIAVIYYLLFVDSKTKNSLIWKFILGLCLIALIGLAGWQLTGHFTSQRSFMYRIDSALAGLRTWKEHVIFGVGYGNTGDILSNADIDRISNGISMGMTSLLAYGGIYLTAFVLFPALYLLKLLKQSSFYSIYIMVFVVVMTDLIISNIYNSFYFIFILASGYAVLISRKNIVLLQ